MSTVKRRLRDAGLLGRVPLSSVCVLLPILIFTFYWLVWDMAFSLQLCLDGQHPGVASSLTCSIQISHFQLQSSFATWTMSAMYFWSIWCNFNGQKICFSFKSPNFWKVVYKGNAVFKFQSRIQYGLNWAPGLCMLRTVNNLLLSTATHLFLYVTACTFFHSLSSLWSFTVH